MLAPTPEELALADELIRAGDAASLLPLPSATRPGFDLASAWRVAREIERRRIRLGDQPAGWKIGFTNRSIWPRYGVHQPIWGRVWRSTLVLLDGAEAVVSLSGLVQPRIEPEIVFGFARQPASGMSEGELLGCLAWVGHGVEVVHTHFAGWRFGAAADTVADGGLHGRLIVGPRVPVGGWSTLGRDLAALKLTLQCDGRVVDRGTGAAVLDGPLDALRAWIAAMAESTPDWPVLPGDVVTTGTLTDAWPIAPGETWTTHPDDPRVAGLSLRFGA